ncbi:MAG TPA: M28 family peptidase, partial [Armatimonadota bacterium]|nr:M28 family peptidase [Armatimonadota bacterium]
ASDELEGRGSGTSGNDRAADYIAGRFKAVGLKPAGENGSYFQRFTVFTGVKLGDDNSLALRGGDAPGTLQVRDDFMPLSYSKNGSVEAPLVFAGYGISKPELGYDDYANLDVRGKIAVVLRHTPDGDINGKLGPYAPLSYKTRTARDKGAAGLLLVSGPMSDQPENLGVFSLDSASADSGIQVAFVKRAAIDKLLASVNTTLRDLQVVMAHGQPKSFAIPGATATLRVDVRRQTAPTRNVLGMLEGSDPKLKHEVVVIGAHYDHLGMGGAHSLDASSQPAIHHGADDNASGTAGVLELAQYFAANRGKIGRSLLFMGFSGEEIGLIGSGHWTKKPTIPLQRVVAMLNLDMVGRMKANDTFYIIGSDTSPVWKGLVDEVNKPLRLQPKLGGDNAFGGSDQQSFIEKNIPVLFFFTGTHPDYHRPSDTWEKLNGPGTAKLVQFVADTTQRLSRLKQRPLFTKSTSQTPAANPGFRVYLGTIPDYGAEVEGVALQGVREGSPADKGGLRAEDVLVEFDGKSIRNVQEYTSVLAEVKPDVPVKVVILRKGERVTLTITPAARRN